MSLLARAKQKDPALGYTPDFIDAVAPLLPQIARQGIKVVVNAGGLNPDGCRTALAKAAEAAGVALKIAVVEGDDLLPQLEAIRAGAPKEMFSGAPLPAKIVSMNAYLGARPIAAALDAGAQVVVTGRCVDSALALGPLMHEFGWSRHRLRPAVGRQPRGPPDRVRRTGCRADCSPTGTRCRAGTTWGSRSPNARRRIVRDHEAGRHRRTCDARVGLRADALRDRRSWRVSAARRHVRLDRGALRAVRR